MRHAPKPKAPGAKELLNAWRGERSFAWLGEQIGVSRSYASNLCAGYRTPGTLIASRIFKVTGIRPEAWHPEVNEEATHAA